MAEIYVILVLTFTLVTLILLTVRLWQLVRKERNSIKAVKIKRKKDNDKCD